MDQETSVVESLDRLKIKEERAIKNKIKKTIKKLERKKEREQQELLFKIRPIGGNIHLITQDFAEKFSKKTQTPNSTDISNNEINFPTLGRSNRPPRRDVGNVNSLSNFGCSSDKQVLSLGDFIITKPEASKAFKNVKTIKETEYAGNSLDSDFPIRKRGKYREIPKPKKHTALKRGIYQDRAEYMENQEVQKLCLKDVFPEFIIMQEIDDKVKIFIERVVELQEKLYKRDSLKGKYKRRYVVGFHETKKYLILNKVKVVVIATDVQFVKINDAMSSVILEIIELCKKNEVLHFFALKRRKLGILTLKYIPVSCIAILNYEGAEEQLNKMTIFYNQLGGEEGALDNSPHEDENG